MASPRIVLLHATSVAMDPTRIAFAVAWPEAETVSLLDDGLTIDRAREDDLSERTIERFVALCRYAHRSGADGVLAPCSAFGPAIERAAAEFPVPVLKPNEAMFEAAFAAGRSIGMVATFAPAASIMAAEFVEEAARLNAPAQLSTIVILEAMAALRSGDVATHDRLIAERASNLAALEQHPITLRSAAAPGS
ncbi:hypothetical protein OPKNFCMD_6757 [Methylobacterium crusticola]|uniref:Arylsulfatase n=1 Tax=Methylobacterium crusticola TaxID=1697972 RepID=A0ABQ4RB86_9HYPH|nr:aspartate/glutamate racemase family protein [Methylobacterium crusticola]GJD53977.1 hypothetical protein OPKNFCMD_6757 [Methylobacterium crusticola]